jgi:hypothetical protein
MWRRRHRRLVRLLGRLLPAGGAGALRVLTIPSGTAQGLLTQPSEGRDMRLIAILGLLAAIAILVL